MSQILLRQNLLVLSGASLKQSLGAWAGTADGHSDGWRFEKILLTSFGLGAVFVFLRHVDTAASWAGRTRLPRLSLCLPFFPMATIYVRRHLPRSIGSPLSIGAFVSIVVACLWGEAAIVPAVASTQRDVFVLVLDFFSDKVLVANKKKYILLMKSVNEWIGACAVTSGCEGYQVLVSGAVISITLTSGLAIRWSRKVAFLFVVVTIRFFGNTFRVLLCANRMAAWAQGILRAAEGELTIFGVQVLLVARIVRFFETLTRELGSGGRLQPLTSLER